MHEGGGEQTRLWNGVAGQAWVDEQPVLDHMYKPIEALLVDAVRIESRGRVLDVGCGTGGTTLAVAQLFGTKGNCVGIDVSEPMIALARTRAQRAGIPVEFIRANAQDYAFEPARFDMIVSRFGVMFFDDAIRAFANLRSAATDDASVRFVVWRSAADNAFMTTAERAAAPLLPNLPARRPDAPGQFAFANRDRVHAILEESGWTDIDIRPIDIECTFPESHLIGYVTRLGPVGQILHDADDRVRAQVIDTVRTAFEPYVHGTDVRFTAACWMVGARAGVTSSASTGARRS